jgi:DNA-binding NarL/FixJ family response regulator
VLIVALVVVALSADAEFVRAAEKCGVRCVLSQGVRPEVFVTYVRGLIG